MGFDAAEVSRRSTPGLGRLQKLALGLKRRGMHTAAPQNWTSDTAARHYTKAPATSNQQPATLLL
jgi:hypothetical protein